MSSFRITPMGAGRPHIPRRRQRISFQSLLERLPRGRREWRAWCIKATAVGGVLGCAYLGFLWLTLPDISDPRALIADQSTLITDRNGTELYRLFDEEDRTFIPGEQIPESLKKAIVAIEDARFYTRGCIDMRAMARVVLRFGRAGGASTLTRQLARNALDLQRENIVSRKLKELFLGCALESQYSKEELLVLYLNWIPFGRNAYGAEQASRAYFSKSASGLTLAESAILAALPQRPSYFSPYGKNVRTRVTDDALARILSGDIRAADDLDDDDVIIGLMGNAIGTGATTIYVGGRTDQVLHNMKEMEFITEEERVKALDELRTITFKAAREDIRAPHFVLWVRSLVQEVLQGAGEEVLDRGGLTIETTLDWDLQQAADAAVQQQKDDILKRFEAHNIALLSLDPQTREILAYVGNSDYNDEEHGGKVDMTRAPRQPGSTFKPLVYAAAFQQGYGPATVLYDVPTKFGEDQPQNFDGQFWGLIDARHALASSRNIPAIKAFYLSGDDDREDRILALAAGLGAPSPLQQREALRAAERARGVTTDNLYSYGYPLAIGAAETPLLEMVQMYAAFADGGRSSPPIAIRRITDRHGNVLFTAPAPQQTPVLDPRIAYAITSILSDASARPNEYWRSVLSIPGWEAAAKTGTSNKCLERFEEGKDKGRCKDLRPSDLWTVGYSPALVTGVWVGNANGAALSNKAESLITAAPIWKSYMVNAHARKMQGKATAFTMPDDIVYPQISALSGELPSECTPVELRRPDLFLAENAPSLQDPACAQLEIDKVTRLLASESCPAEAREKGSFLIATSVAAERWPNWQTGVDEWAKRQMELWLARPDHSGSLLPLPLAPSGVCDIALTPGRLQKPVISLSFPKDGGIAPYPAFQPQFDAESASRIREIRYALDDRIVATGSGAERLSISAPRSMKADGLHTLTITVVDEYYNEASASASFRFQDDNTPPSVRFISPSAGSFVPSGAPLLLRASADDGEGGLKYVQFYLGTRLLSTKPNAPYELLYDAEIRPGTYELRAVATDFAGNESEDSVDITITQ